MERTIRFYPAYDKRDADPKKNFGVHGVDMRWLLKGELGAVQFVVYTNWYLSLIGDLMFSSDKISPPMPADRGYHSPVPLYDDQSIVSESCEYLDGKPCYYDGSGLAAEDLFNTLIKEGDEAVWKELEEYYTHTFGELK